MSNPSGLSSCCVSGHLHEGTPTGTIEKIEGLDVYVAKTESGSKAKTVIFITDVFGWAVPNARLLADEYAKAGFYTYIPDLHQGDSVPYSMLLTIQPAEPEKRTPEQAQADHDKTMAYVGPWSQKHSKEVVRPLLDKFVAHLRADPAVGKLGAVGFCWGAMYALDLADSGSVDAIVGNHPSFAGEPEFSGVTKPTQINVGDNDVFMSNEFIAEVKAAMEKKTHVPFEVNIIHTAVHGFAVRGDLTNPQQKANKEKAYENTVRWFNTYLA